MTQKCFVILLVFICIFLASCNRKSETNNSFNTNQSGASLNSTDSNLDDADPSDINSSGDASDVKYKTIVKFEDNFDGDGFAAFWDFEAANKDRFSLMLDPLNSNNTVLEVVLLPNDRSANGHRAELKIKSEENKVGRVVKYYFKFMLPSEFFIGKPNGKWIMIHQWHDQPPKGVSWDSYPGNHAPLNLFFSTSSNPHDFKISLAYGLWGTLSTNEDIRENKNMIFQKELVPDVWHTFENTVRWDTTIAGYSIPMIDGKVIYSLNNEGKISGRNVFNEAGNYLKLGFYVDKDLDDHALRIFYDNFKYELLEESN